MPDLSPIQSEAFNKLGISHGFFTRKGGVSSGIYEGLNVGLGSDDKRADVLENRSRVASYFSMTPDKLLTPYQIHSADVIEVRNPWGGSERPRVDALVTSNPEITVGILTADCGPVLFADREQGIVGAAHAGWKGATGGILERTVSAMETLGSDRKDITAILGPTISQDNYEVGPEFVENLLALDSDNTDYFKDSAKAGHAMFDLPAYAISRLTVAGVKAHWTQHCTYADPKQFFSYRRTTHNSDPDYGRQISAISLKGL